MNVGCVGAVVFGLFIGYVFAWSTRRNEPNGTDVAGLLGIILGGTLLQVVDKIHCENALPLYLIGMAVGYVIYIILLKVNWPAVKHSYDIHGQNPSPFFPFLVRGTCHENDRPPQR
jgi:xanthosine utilization system XapX-like protein